MNIKLQKLIEACSYIKKGTRCFNLFNRWCKKDPELFFRKRNLLEEYLEYKEYFKDEESFFKLIKNDYYIENEKYQSNDKCIFCGEKAIFVSFNYGYTKTCGKDICKGNCRKITMQEKGTWEESFAKIKNSWKNKTPEEIQEHINKNKVSKLKNHGNENYNNREKFTKTMMNLYGTTHALCYNTFKEKALESRANKTEEEKRTTLLKREQSMLKIYNVKYPYQNKAISKKGIKKQKDTNIKSGRWIPDDLKTDYELYVRSVSKETEKIYKEKIDIIDPDRKRKAGVYELDHIFSKKEGFENNIPVCYIADASNLRIISKSENASKGYRCDKNIEQLFENFYKNKKA